MKENKKAIKWLGIIFAISLVFNISFYVLNHTVLLCNEKLIALKVIFDWLIGFTSAVFTGAIVSIIVCIINYISLRQKQLERVVFLLYQKDSQLNAILYNKENDIDIKNALKLDSSYDSSSQEIYQILNELQESLFKFEKSRRKLIKEFLSCFLVEYNFYAEFGAYIDLYHEHFNLNSKKIYKILQNEIDKNGLYDKSFKLAREFGCKIYSPSETDDKDNKRREMADRFKKRVDSFKDENDN